MKTAHKLQSSQVISHHLLSTSTRVSHRWWWRFLSRVFDSLQSFCRKSATTRNHTTWERRRRRIKKSEKQATRRDSNRAVWHVLSSHFLAFCSELFSLSWCVVSLATLRDEMEKSLSLRSGKGRVKECCVCALVCLDLSPFNGVTLKEHKSQRLSLCFVHPSCSLFLMLFLFVAKTCVPCLEHHFYRTLPFFSVLSSLSLLPLKRIFLEKNLCSQCNQRRDEKIT